MPTTNSCNLLLRIVVAVLIVPYAVSAGAQAGGEVKDDLNALWLKDYDAMEHSELESSIVTVKELMHEAPNDLAYCSGLLLLGKLYMLSDDESAALGAYQQVIDAPASISVEYHALQGQRRVYEHFDHWEKAVAVAELLIETIMVRTDEQGSLDSFERGMMGSELLWLVDYYERRKDYRTAAEYCSRLADHHQSRSTSWSVLRKLAQLLEKTGMSEEARVVFQEARIALSQKPDISVDHYFLATECGLLRGAYGGMVTREYLQEANALVERYRGCGPCTLRSEYNIAMETLLFLRDLTDAETMDAIERLRVVLRRVPEARTDSDGEFGGLGLLSRDGERTAYMTIIDVLAIQRWPADESALDDLSAFLEAFEDDAEALKFARRTVNRPASQFDDEVWGDYPTVRRLLRRDTSDEDAVWPTSNEDQRPDSVESSNGHVETNEAPDEGTVDTSRSQPGEISREDTQDTMGTSNRSNKGSPKLANGRPARDEQMDDGSNDVEEPQARGVEGTQNRENSVPGVPVDLNKSPHEQSDMAEAGSIGAPESSVAPSRNGSGIDADASGDDNISRTTRRSVASDQNDESDRSASYAWPIGGAILMIVFAYLAWSKFRGRG